MWYAVDPSDRIAYGPFEFVEDAEAYVFNTLGEDAYVSDDTELDEDLTFVLMT